MILHGLLYGFASSVIQCRQYSSGGRCKAARAGSSAYLPAGAGNRMRCSALTLKAGARLSYGVYMLTDCSGRFVFMVCPICLSFTRGDFIE